MIGIIFCRSFLGFPWLLGSGFAFVGDVVPSCSRSRSMATSTAVLGTLLKPSSCPTRFINVSRGTGAFPS